MRLDACTQGRANNPASATTINTKRKLFRRRLPATTATAADYQTTHFNNDNNNVNSNALYQQSMSSGQHSITQQQYGETCSSLFDAEHNSSADDDLAQCAQAAKTKCSHRTSTDAALHHIYAETAPSAPFSMSFESQTTTTAVAHFCGDRKHQKSTRFCNSYSWQCALRTKSRGGEKKVLSCTVSLISLCAALLLFDATDALLVQHHNGGGFRGVPGSFCATLPHNSYGSSNNNNPQCCSSRNDSCAVPIGGTLCYCDIFCDRQSGPHPAQQNDPSGKSYYDYGDCCPDFWCHCRGERDQCLHGPQSPHIASTLFAHSTTSTTASPRRSRVSRPLSTGDGAWSSDNVAGEDYYFDQELQQQQADQQNLPCYYHPREHEHESDYVHEQTAFAVALGQTIRVNCNWCTCRRHATSSAMPHLECTKHLCIVEPRFIAHLNGHWNSYGWRAAENYSHYWSRTLQWGFKHRLGTHTPSADTLATIPVRVHGAQLERIPPAFDAREHWPALNTAVVDQGACGGSWAFSTVQMAQDRLNVIFGGHTLMPPSVLSIQHLLACDRKRDQLGCDGGGHVDRAWWYMRKKGVVSDGCYPTKSDWWWHNSTQYGGGGQQAQIKRNERLTPRCELSKAQQLGDESVQCPAAGSQLGRRTLRYKMSPAYRIAPIETEIQTEILRSGPVQAIIRVRPDFFMYQDGVYRYTSQLAQSLLPDKYYAYYHHRENNDKIENSTTAPPLPEPLEAQHAVRIIGWGVDYSSGRPLNYWECANTWGAWWGRDGYFRILRGASESDVETFVIGVWPRRPTNNDDSTRHYSRQLRRKRERRRLKTLKQRRRWERYFTRRHQRLEQRKRDMGLQRPYYYNTGNNQLERLKRLSRAVQRAIQSESIT